MVIKLLYTPVLFLPVQLFSLQCYSNKQPVKYMYRHIHVHSRLQYFLEQGARIAFKLHWDNLFTTNSSRSEQLSFVPEKKDMFVHCYVSAGSSWVTGQDHKVVNASIMSVLTSTLTSRQSQMDKPPKTIYPTPIPYSLIIPF